LVRRREVGGANKLECTAIMALPLADILLRPNFVQC